MGSLYSRSTKRLHVRHFHNGSYGAQGLPIHPCKLRFISQQRPGIETCWKLLTDISPYPANAVSPDQKYSGENVKNPAKTPEKAFGKHSPTVAALSINNPAAGRGSFEIASDPCPHKFWFARWHLDTAQPFPVSPFRLASEVVAGEVWKCLGDLHVNQEEHKQFRTLLEV